MRWILIVLLMCNGVYFVWHSYMVSNESLSPGTPLAQRGGTVQTKIVLLQESPQLALLDATVAGSVTALPDDNADDDSQVMQIQEPPAVCWLVGPFKEMVSGKQIVGRMEALDISMELTSMTTEGLPDYWVHLTPQSSRREAIKLLRELQAKKIDSFLITKGELENGISLGFFTQKKRAQKVFSARVKQGYKAIIKEVPRTLTQIWAVFDTGKYGEFTNELWEKIKEGNSGIERRKNFCDKIASVGDLD